MMAAATAAKRHTPSLMFMVGDMPCRIELTRLHRVAPWAALEPADDPDLLGWLSLEWERIPVVDLAKLVLGQATPRQLGSRILVLPCTTADGSTRLVGALAGEVFSLTRAEDEETTQRFDPCELMGALLQRLA